MIIPRNTIELLDEVDLKRIITRMNSAAESAQNEEQLKIALEHELASLCLDLGISWNPYTYETTLGNKKFRADAIHGATIIEYEAPGSFNGINNAKLKHARKQTELYCELLSSEEGRVKNAYTLVVWDGFTISFGKWHSDKYVWEVPADLNESTLHALLHAITLQQKPLVSPLILTQLLGPFTELGQSIISEFYEAVEASLNETTPNKIRLVYSEWARLFSQVDGIQIERLAKYLERRFAHQNKRYHTLPEAYIFALNTYIALIAKLCAAYALLSGEESMQHEDPLLFLRELESNSFFRLKGIKNMFTTDFFSWYIYDIESKSLHDKLDMLLNTISTIDFSLDRKSDQTVRDLFKGIYMQFIPKEIRHALGEYYTPDWLASHVVDASSWLETDTFLDPTCGSGTFILEALKRRLENADATTQAHDLLQGIYGFDLNPLAVLCAKSSITVLLSKYFYQSTLIQTTPSRFPSI